MISLGRSNVNFVIIGQASQALLNLMLMLFISIWSLLSVTAVTTEQLRKQRWKDMSEACICYLKNSSVMNVITQHLKNQPLNIMLKLCIWVSKTINVNIAITLQAPSQVS